MATKATSSTRCKPIPAAVAIVALGGMLIGCQADSAALMYAQEAHAQKVAAWCYAYSGVTTASLQEDCVRRVWANVPLSQYWIKHYSKVAPCRCGTGSGAALTSEASAAGPQQETVTPPDGTVKPAQ
jgi:hypothetical protein